MFLENARRIDPTAYKYPLIMEARPLIDRLLESADPTAQLVLTEAEQDKVVEEGKNWLEESKRMLELKKAQHATASDLAKVHAQWTAGIYIVSLLVGFLGFPLVLVTGYVGILLFAVISTLLSIAFWINAVLAVGNFAASVSIKKQMEQELDKLEGIRSRSSDRKVKEKIDDLITRVRRDMD
jgi:hypothetical protein